MNKVNRIYTWLDIRRVFREVTNLGSNYPAQIARISCFSDSVEIGLTPGASISDVKHILMDWFGDWFQEEKSQIQLDIGDSFMPVEFFCNEKKPDDRLPIRPLWEEVIYAKPKLSESAQGLLSDTESPLVLLPNHFPSKKPNLVAFYSFKGGVGRTVHLSAFLFALLERAKQQQLKINILIIDADLEAPGLTYWNLHEKQQPTVSFIDFLECYHYPPTDLAVTIQHFAREIRKSARFDGKSAIYFLPAFLDEKQLFDTPVLPENLVRMPDESWGCGDAIYRLGKALEADYVLIDLRAGLSEVSSPIIFDPRVQRFIISTIAEQSVKGTILVLERVRYIIPPEPTQEIDTQEYYDPSLIISMLKPEFKDLPEYEDAMADLRSAYTSSGDDNVYSKRLTIAETDFAEELLYLKNWEECRSRLSASSVMKVAREWVDNEFLRLREAPAEIISSEHLEEQIKEVRSLHEICQKYEFAENGTGEGLLVTEPLKNLASAFLDKLPHVVSIGAKGAGKTFNYVQLSRLKTWDRFIKKALKDSSLSSDSRNTYFFPFLQSRTLKGQARLIVDEARDELFRILKIESAGFLLSECEDRIKAFLNGNHDELEWLEFWIKEIGSIVGLKHVDGGKVTLQDINVALHQSDYRIVFLLDGLEDLFADIAIEKSQQIALKALLDIPRRLSEMRQPCLGIIIFLRRDFLNHIISQNLAQFENLYRSFELVWNEEAFIKLVYWICSSANIIKAKEEHIDMIELASIHHCLTPLWGTKLGSDNSKEAYTMRWVFAALTDFKGRLQARDIVRFLLHAAEITLEQKTEVAFEKWASSRLLPPQSIRRALDPCSKKKVQEAKEEYPQFREWEDKIRTKVRPSERRIPFALGQYSMDESNVTLLEEMGVIYEDRDKKDPARFYMPEIFRAGLEFNLDKGARPRVLVLKKKAVG